MAFQVEGDAVLLAGVPDRAETLDQQFQAHLPHVGDGVAGEAGRQWREQEEMAPAMGRRADEARHGDLAILQLAEVVRQPDAADEALGGLLVDQLADLVGDVIGIGARRLVALVAPGLVCLDRLAADELQRLGARLVAEGLALQVRGDGEDFQAVLLGQVDALLGIRLGAGVGVAAGQVELPARFFPAVEAGVLDELDPLLHRHVAELAADQADLVVRAFAVAVRVGLLEAHNDLSVACAEPWGGCVTTGRLYTGLHRVQAPTPPPLAGSRCAVIVTDTMNRGLTGPRPLPGELYQAGPV